MRAFDVVPGQGGGDGRFSLVSGQPRKGLLLARVRLDDGTVSPMLQQVRGCAAQLCAAACSMLRSCPPQALPMTAWPQVRSLRCRLSNMQAMQQGYHGVRGHRVRGSAGCSQYMASQLDPPRQGRAVAAFLSAVGAACADPDALVALQGGSGRF